MKYIFIFAFVLCCHTLFSQNLVVIGSDTLPAEALEGKTIYDGKIVTYDQFALLHYLNNDDLVKIDIESPRSKCEMEIHKKYGVKTNDTTFAQKKREKYMITKGQLKSLQEFLNERNGKGWAKRLKEELKVCRESEKFDFIVKHP